MKIEKITYQKAFVIGPYLQEKIGIEVVLGPNDDADEAFRQAHSIVTDWHKTNYPDEIPSQSAPAGETLPTINRAHERLLVLIEQAPDIPALQSFSADAYKTGNEAIIDAYRTKMEEFLKEP